VVNFAFDYFVMVAIAATGGLQITAAVAGLNGLLFVRPPSFAIGLGGVLVLAGYVVFFATTDRNINDFEGGLDGNVQFMLFAAGAASATLLTFVISSLVNRRMRAPDGSGTGFDALQRANFFSALRWSLSSWRG